MLKVVVIGDQQISPKTAYYNYSICSMRIIARLSKPILLISISGWYLYLICLSIIVSS